MTSPEPTLGQEIQDAVVLEHIQKIFQPVEQQGIVLADADADGLDAERLVAHKALVLVPEGLDHHIGVIGHEGLDGFGLEQIQGFVGGFDDDKFRLGKHLPGDALRRRPPGESDAEIRIVHIRRAVDVQGDFLGRQQGLTGNEIGPHIGDAEIAIRSDGHAREDQVDAFFLQGGNQFVKGNDLHPQLDAHRRSHGLGEIVFQTLDKAIFRFERQRRIGGRSADDEFLLFQDTVDRRTRGSRGGKAKNKDKCHKQPDKSSFHSSSP